MRTTILCVAIAALSLGCSKPSENASTSASNESIPLPVEFTYKGRPAVGNQQNVKVVADCNKRLSELNGDIDEFLADSLHWKMADGAEFDLPRDSAVAMVKAFIGSLSNMKIIYISQIPIDNQDAGDEWVLSWTDETYTYKDGKVEHNLVHEDYRLVNGKIREVLQYIQKPSAATN